MSLTSGKAGGALVLAAMLVLSVAGVAAGQPAVDGGQSQTDPAAEPPAFVVAVAPDGGAEVTVTYTFDLTDETRQQAFADLQSNETAQAAFRDRFRTLLAGVASDAANATGREMSIQDVSMSMRTEGETGVVALSATWSGLAATVDDRLVVTEPFASGFNPDRAFVVTAPEGYTVASASPAPDHDSDGRVSWESGATLDGFGVSVEPADGTGTTTGAGDGTTATDAGSKPESSGSNGAGFGILAAVLAMVGALVAAGHKIR
jgi:hypothetical protein